MSDKVLNLTSFDAFKFGESGKPLTPTVFKADCECGERLFMMTGFNLSVDIAQDVDLISVCKCGKAYSIIEQTKRQPAKAQEAPAEVVEVLSEQPTEVQSKPKKPKK